ncbi:hypothetical protein CYLTODRAFT_428506 [Cylindrobasidium torrendii FP15055 ss-10]|uniref:Amine oxidase domain-containing protein n=1 Tax=Cylindrobasidium torrendii FP15055 ss-10 TaxID=1314674 RepID=A0A0D7BSA1_9AGAR|nr:hypothetical protein CYLTODRAFT_428506 [Cylindrobasidium torrendii FP15055 ss-10]
MILDSLNIPYEVLEANDRVGGRIYTHRFNGTDGIDAPIGNPARYDYVDIGAMRYPKIKFMERVFDLFERLGLKRDNLLIEYKYSASHTFEHYNGVRHNTSDTGSYDIFGVSENNLGAVPDEFVRKGADKIAEEIFKPYADAFRQEPFAKAWAKLTAQDQHSMRAYLQKQKYPETVVAWLETFQSATGLYNHSFVEATMDAMDFGSSSAAQNGPTEAVFDWYCIDGGSDHFTSRMARLLKPEPVLGARVTKMESVGNEMEVTFVHGDEVKIKVYSQVISTVPLGCLAAIDIPKHSNRDPLSYMQRQAIRSLNYDTSTKDPAIMGDRVIQGGISRSDLPIRTCVYPSYGFGVTSVSGVILASYTWGQDAQRFGGLAQDKGSPADQRLIELTLKNLSDMHGIPVEKFGRLVDHYTYNWHNDEFARGAFALFGTAQFADGTERGNTMFASMKAPAAGGKLHIAGEATSVHHAWVLGSLNSAWRAVFNALGKHSDPHAKREQLQKEWGVPGEENTKSLLELCALSAVGAF